MSALLESLLTTEQRAEADRNDRDQGCGHMARAGRNHPDPVKGQALADSVRRGEGSLPAPLITAEMELVIRGEPYTWPQVAWRTDAPRRRLGDGPRPSRWGDLV